MRNVTNICLLNITENILIFIFIFGNSVRSSYLCDNTAELVVPMMIIQI